MKKICVYIVFLLAVAQIFCGCAVNTNSEEKFLRVHVCADSDSVSAQSAAREVFAAINCYLAGELDSAQSYKKAYGAVKARLNQIEFIANAVLKRKGFGYSASVTLSSRYCKASVVGDKVLDAGEYDALTVKLGCGYGNAKVSLLYPQTYSESESSDIKYKSLIADILSRHN